jgi:hypothetical protein
MELDTCLKVRFVCFQKRKIRFVLHKKKERRKKHSISHFGFGK